jgi:hypothetical protein
MGTDAVTFIWSIGGAFGPSIFVPPKWPIIVPTILAVPLAAVSFSLASLVSPLDVLVVVSTSATMGAVFVQPGTPETKQMMVVMEAVQVMSGPTVAGVALCPVMMLAMMMPTKGRLSVMMRLLQMVIEMVVRMIIRVVLVTSARYCVVKGLETVRGLHGDRVGHGRRDGET